eukprot:INCI6872.1.p1 GENE.INCI6872.1~~INCI6872.1.p1  ORF type:complete len:322 (-),score=53.65 INCI6872.1:134-1099(-)
MKVVAIALGLFVATYVAVSSIRWAVQTHEEAATADVVPDAVVPKVARLEEHHTRHDDPGLRGFENAAPPPANVAAGRFGEYQNHNLPPQGEGSAGATGGKTGPLGVGRRGACENDGDPCPTIAGMGACRFRAQIGNFVCVPPADCDGKGDGDSCRLAGGGALPPGFGGGSADETGSGLPPQPEQGVCKQNPDSLQWFCVPLSHVARQQQRQQLPPGGGPRGPGGNPGWMRNGIGGGSAPAGAGAFGGGNNGPGGAGGFRGMGGAGFSAQGGARAPGAGAGANFGFNGAVQNGASNGPNGGFGGNRQGFYSSAPAQNQVAYY